MLYLKIITHTDERGSVLLNIDKLVSIAINNLKQKNRISLYTDEPILKRTSQLSGYVPEKIAEMRKMAKEWDYYIQSDGALFYSQGKFMEDYEDDFEYKGELLRYYPTYQSMNNDQLRGYFTWRKNVRNGNIEKTSASFAYMYVYELINMIGVKTEEEGFNKLNNFWNAYKEFEPRLDFYLKTWLNDYVVYYNLDKSLLSDELRDSLKMDDESVILSEYASHSDEEIFNAVNSLSSYNIKESSFGRQYPVDTADIVCGIYKKLCEYYSKHRKKSLFENLFGSQMYNKYYIFSNAVFHDTRKYSHYVYTISPVYRYICKNGTWISEGYYSNGKKSKKLGSILRVTDSIMRQKYEFKHQLKKEETTALVLNIIEKEIDGYLKEKKKVTKTIEKTKIKIEIDISKLQEIRQSADIIRDKLIVDEEAEDIDILSCEEQNADCNTVMDTCEDIQADADEKNENILPLDDNEYKVLRCLLHGEEYSTFLKEKGLMLSVVADSINEKLFDMFGDTVIDFDGDVPMLIDDYTDELKGIITK